MNKTSMQNINKETEVLNNTINKLNLTDNYRMFYPTIAEYILLKLYMEISLGYTLG